MVADATNLQIRKASSQRGRGYRVSASTGCTRSVCHSHTNKVRCGDDAPGRASTTATKLAATRCNSDEFKPRVSVTAATTTSSHGYDGVTAHSRSARIADPETGLIYLRNRYYDPNTGQFLTPDPLFAISGERYGYAGNNPLNQDDPSGLWCPLGHNSNGSCRGRNVGNDLHFASSTLEFVAVVGVVLAAPETAPAFAAALAPTATLSAISLHAVDAYLEYRQDGGCKNRCRANLVEGAMDGAMIYLGTKYGANVTFGYAAMSWGSQLMVAGNGQVAATSCHLQSDGP